MAYERGELGLVTDEEEALSLHRKAAEGGLAEAQRRLGWAYEGGEIVVAINFVKVLIYFREAAVGGDATLRRKGDLERPAATAISASSPSRRGL